MNTDHNLLLGILALQMDFIDRDTLVASMQAWVLEKSKPLGEILQAQGHLSSQRRQLLDALVGEHLKQHDNDAQQSLAAVSSVGSVRADLKRLADPDIEASLARFPAGRGADRPSETVPLPTGAPIFAGTRFRILRPHARGGLGEVYVAQDEGLHREVALKEIQERYADNTESRSRFLLEAEITGGLEHPGIVPVYGLGVYADGRPFYAMRFIRGDSLMEAIAQFHDGKANGRDSSQRGLALRKLLGRFVDVCNAIEYAHSRGILHRDLKPGNIMLGKYGETLVVDWGLAKWVGHPETPGGSGERSLRPSVASASTPTQMGATVGTPQYMSPEQAEGRIDELGPASDVYGLGATLYALLTGRAPLEDDDLGALLRRVAKGDFTPPRQVRPDVPRALEAVCLKAMALRPTDRYPSPQAFADDIERWLADEPVRAYQEPLALRVGRWTRRHKPLVAAGVVLLGTTAVALAVSNALVTREQAHTEQRRQEVVAAEARAKEAQTFAEKQARKAEHRFTLALDAFQELVHNVQNKLEARPGTQALRHALPSSAQKGLAALIEDAERSNAAQSTLVWSYLRMGDVYLLMNQTRLAFQEYEHAVRLAETAAKQDTADPGAQRDLAVAYLRLGDVEWQLNHVHAAHEAFLQAMEINRRRSRETDDPQAQRDLSLNYNRLGDVAEELGNLSAARDAFREGLAIAERLAQTAPADAQAQRDLAFSHSRIGDIELKLGHLRPGREAFEAGLAIAQRLDETAPDDPDTRRTLALAYMKIGNLQARMANFAAARLALQKSLEIQQGLAQSDPENPIAQRNLSFSHFYLGDLDLKQNDMPAAREAFQKCLEIDRRRAERDPENGEAQADLAISYGRVGVVEMQLGHLAAARELLLRNLEITEQLAATESEDAHMQRNLSFCRVKLGDVEARLGDLPAARASYQRALEIRQRLAQADPQSAQAQDDLSYAYYFLGAVLLDMGDLAAARVAYGHCVELDRRPAQADPADFQAQRDLSISYRKFAAVCSRLGQFPDALEAYQQALQIHLRLVKEEPDNAQFQEDLSYGYYYLAALHLEMGDLPAARDEYVQSVELDRRLAEAAPENAQAHVDLAISCAKLADVCSRIAQLDPGNGPNLYQAARGFAKCAFAVPGGRSAEQLSAVDRTLKEFYAAQAVEQLKRAHAAGYFTIAATVTAISEDHDLDSLRDRDDFRKLVEELRRNH
ncbi:MAG TPA: protein kinase [Pirellulales bacterium]|nr:protein kinase [Pirellulales bacterium]